MSEEKLCEKCGGSGKIMVDAMTHKMCLCLYNRKMRTHLGTDLATATPVKNSPLYQEVVQPDGKTSLVDLTKKNLFVKAWWDELRGHLKWTFYCKGPTFFFQTVTDERVRNVFVGNEQYSHRTRKTRDDVEANNSLRDLLGETWHLAIIRIGFLGYRNQAMAGALLEALRIRESLVLPTWIIEEPRSILAPGHFSYSEELFDYINYNFETIDLVGDKSRRETPRGMIGAPLEDDTGMSLDDGRPERALPDADERPEFDHPPVRIPKEVLADFMDPVLTGSNRKNKSYPKKSGGGPLG